MFLAETPEEALAKLKELSENWNQVEVLKYAKHLAELVTMIGDPVIPHLSAILNSLVNFRAAASAQIPHF
jgi:hypothetical protein